RIEESVNATLEAEVLTRSSHSSRTSYAVTADLSEMELKNILIEKMEGNKSIQRSDEQRNLYKTLAEAYDADKTILDTYGESTILKRRRKDDDQEGPFARSDRGSKRQREGGEHASASTPSEIATGSAGRSTTGELARQTDAWSSFNELLNSPIDFSNFIMNRLGVDTLTPEILAGPTYELMRGSCNSLTELEYHLEEVYKATTDQLDWANPKGQQYPHNLLQPLPLISDYRGRRVILFEHFINNDLEYLGGGMPFEEFLTRGGNVSSSMGSQLTKNLLSMYTPREGSSLSASSRLWNGTTISIWIGFRDGTLNDVLNSLDDRLKGIRMQYLPHTISRR
nr:hypothetical protein [Tanacetum cinerariifolium]